VALDPADGSVKWRARVAATASSPVVVDDLVVLGLTDGVKAFSVENGTRRWSYKTEAAVESSPVVLPGRIVVADDARTIYALSSKRGKRIWRRSIPEGTVRESPTVYGDTIFFSTSGATFRAIRGSDGEDVWSRFVGSLTTSSPPADSCTSPPARASTPWSAPTATTSTVSSCPVITPHPSWWTVSSTWWR
jgi:eukaryotic-like serine/threonine-protein kinase